MDADQEIRELVTDVWEEVLGHDGFGPDDDFFAVGGDSLRAAVLVRRLTAAGVVVDLAGLVRAPTVAGIAAAAAGGTGSGRPGITAVPR